MPTADRTVAALDWLHAAALDRDARGLRRILRPRSPEDRLLDVASNDYLGLARDPRVVAGASEAASRWGAGSTGSRLVTGTTELHAQLEDELAAFLGTAAALVFSSGYLANLAALTALAGPDCLVVSDTLNHASIVDACRLARSPVAVVSHRHVESFDAALGARAQPRALVVTDAVFSVDGDVAPLQALHEVVRTHGAILLVDEAHSLGVLGPGGRGAIAGAGLAGEPDVVVTVTLSKSLGSQGGAVLGHAAVIEHLLNSARTFIFDTGLAPACTGAALAALRILRSAPALADLVRQRAVDLASAAEAAGWTATPPSAAVTSLLAGSAEDAVAAAAECAERGVRVGCFRPPSVPDGMSRLRLTARATLAPSDVEHVGDVLAQVRARRTR